MNKKAGITLVRDVSSTPADFERHLRQSHIGDVSGGCNAFTVKTDKACLHFAISPRPERHIAMLTLPRIEVCITGEEGSLHEQQNLLKRLDRLMQRGGG